MLQQRPNLEAGSLNNFDSISLSEHVLWLIISIITSLLLYAFLTYFIYTIANLIKRTVVDHYTVATFVLLSFGILIQSAALTCKNTMSLLYFIATNGEFQWSQAYIEWDSQNYLIFMMYID